MIPRESKTPRENEVMEAVLNRGDAVELARLLSVSPQLIRAWCRPPETEDEFWFRVVLDRFQFQPEESISRQDYCIQR